MTATIVQVFVLICAVTVLATLIQIWMDDDE